MNTSLASKVTILQQRATALRTVREFFHAKGVLEVDCPSLNHAAPIDCHIDVMRVELGDGEWGYLHTSPEYGMKRLLAAGLGDCYQLSHVFRLGEAGKLHNPEFTMLEWYRIGMEYCSFIEETLELLRLLLGPLSVSFLSYRNALQHYADIDYVYATSEELIACAKERGHSLSVKATEWDKDTLLQFLLTSLVEPHLGKNELLVLHDYPATQAALAATKQKQDELIAERFEIYYRGIELANGYHELTDAKEQRQRLEGEEKMRQHLGKPPLPVDENFLKALEEGLPPCSGVAVGFDRLLMLQLGKETLAEVLPFSWNEA